MKLVSLNRTPTLMGLCFSFLILNPSVGVCSGYIRSGVKWLSRPTCTLTPPLRTQWQTHLQARGDLKVRPFFRPGSDPKPFHPPITASEKLKSWLAMHKDEFLAHGIWPNNVSKVIQSGRLLPAEGVLRETGHISLESNRTHGSRKSYSVNTPEIVELFEKIGPIRSCNGVAWIRIEKNLGSDTEYTLLRRDPDFPDWVPVKRIASDATLNDRRLVEGLTDRIGNPLPVDLPVLNCSIDPQTSEYLLRIRGRKFRSLTAGIHPEIYLNFSEETIKRQALISFADHNQIPREILTVAHDQYFGGTADREFLKSLPEFKQAIPKFIENYLALAQQSGGRQTEMENFLQQIGAWTPHDSPSETIEFLIRGLRSALFCGENLQPDISLSCNGLAPYGPVFVLIGQLQKPSLGLPPLLNARHFPGFDDPWMENSQFRLGEYPLFECRSQHPLCRNGTFGKVCLSDQDVLIIGPKKDLNSIPQISHYQVIYSDDLSPEEKRLIPAFGLDYQIRTAVPPGTHPLE